MKISKTLVGIVLVVSFFAPMFAGAQSVADLRAQLEALLRQVAALQQQLKVAQGTQTFCHDFNENLRLGDRGSEVGYLQNYLQKEGFQVSQLEVSGNQYGESTAAAVTGFQQKYQNDVLSPVGLKYGTGFAGVGTRTKLNKLYGCAAAAVTQSTATTSSAPKSETTASPTVKSITITSPVGGWVWRVGEAHNITWSTTGWDSSANVRIGVYDTRHNTESGQYPEIIIASTKNTGSYSWVVPQLSTIDYDVNSANHKVKIYIGEGGMLNTNFSQSPAPFYLIENLSAQTSRGVLEVSLDSANPAGLLIVGSNQSPVASFKIAEVSGNEDVKISAISVRDNFVRYGSNTSALLNPSLYAGDTLVATGAFRTSGTSLGVADFKFITPITISKRSSVVFHLKADVAAYGSISKTANPVVSVILLTEDVDGIGAISGQTIPVTGFAETYRNIAPY